VRAGQEKEKLDHRRSLSKKKKKERAGGGRERRGMGRGEKKRETGRALASGCQPEKPHEITSRFEGKKRGGRGKIRKGVNKRKTGKSPTGGTGKV